MLTPLRRITLYWLLLLLPTLGVGAGALVLLFREQRRLDVEARAAAASQRAATEARARLVAENIELAINDVETGLMATLNDVPAPEWGLQAALDQWQKSNPLVRATFRLARDGQIVKPDSGELRPPLAAWIAAGAPWRTAAAGKSWPQSSQTSPATQAARQGIDANVSQSNSVRNELQGVANQKLPSKASAFPPESEHSGWAVWSDGRQLHLYGWRQPWYGGVVGVEIQLSAIIDQLARLIPFSLDPPVRAMGLRDQNLRVIAGKDYYPPGPDPGHRPISDPTTTWRPGGSRLTPVRGETLLEVPISDRVLPGWTVVAVLAGAPGRDPHALPILGPFFLIGALLVGIFVIAILSGGALLLWQARRSEAEAAQKTSFVANVSHEFKTPLTTIRLYAELLEQGRVRDTAQAGDYLRTIGRETQRLARLVNNALDFSRLEQGRKKFAREPLDLAAELSHLLDVHAPRLAEAGLTVVRELPDHAVPVTTDRDAIEQIVLNLLDNACKYAAAGGELKLALVPGVPGGAQVRVADRGPGVPENHRERIFEKFYRVDDALTAERTGAGLGLSIARQLARGLGGDLRCVARAGGGAEFILELP